MRTQTQTKTKKIQLYKVPEKEEHGLKYPIFRHLCPDVSNEKFEAMRAFACGYAFGGKELPKA